MTATREPQLAMGEQALPDEDLLTKLTERDEAKIRYEDAKAYVEDHIDQLALDDGVYRCGSYRIKVVTKTRFSVKSL